jgi:hypothetical protein
MAGNFRLKHYVSPVDWRGSMSNIRALAATPFPKADGFDPQVGAGSTLLALNR